MTGLQLDHQENEVSNLGYLTATLLPFRNNLQTLDFQLIEYKKSYQHCVTFTM